MQIDFILIGIALATMFFGYFFGLFEGRGQGYKRRKKEEGEEFKSKTPQSPAATPAPAVKDDPGILRLKEENWRMVLDMDGRRVNTDALTSEQRKRLISIVTLMRPWLEGQPSTQSSPSPIGKPQTPLQSQSRFDFSPSATPPVRSEQSGIPSGEQAPVVPPAESEEEKPAPILSIVGQIDSVLQQRLMKSPLAVKGIRLQESPEGGVLVWVGVQKYQSVDEVPDLEIKSAIRAAIKEWEERFTPGD